MENLRLWFEDIVEVLFDFLDLEPKAACTALQMFLWFDGWQVLDLSQEPDQRFLVWWRNGTMRRPVNPTSCPS
jgi:hypothetical protein